MILDEVRAGGRIPLIVGRGLTTRARNRRRCRAFGGRLCGGAEQGADHRVHALEHHADDAVCALMGGIPTPAEYLEQVLAVNAKAAEGYAMDAVG
jgi:aconitase B